MTFFDEIVSVVEKPSFDEVVTINGFYKVFISLHSELEGRSNPNLLLEYVLSAISHDFLSKPKPYLISPELLEQSGVLIAKSSNPLFRTLLANYHFQSLRKKGNADINIYLEELEACVQFIIRRNIYTYELTPLIEKYLQLCISMKSKERFDTIWNVIFKEAQEHLLETGFSKYHFYKLCLSFCGNYTDAIFKLGFYNFEKSRDSGDFRKAIDYLKLLLKNSYRYPDKLSSRDLKEMIQKSYLDSINNMISLEIDPFQIVHECQKGLDFYSKHGGMKELNDEIVINYHKYQKEVPLSFEVHTFSHDITEVINTEKVFIQENDDPNRIIGRFLNIAKPPSYVEAIKIVKGILSESPLGFLFESSYYDVDNRLVHKNKGISLFDFGDDDLFPYSGNYFYKFHVQSKAKVLELYRDYFVRQELVEDILYLFVEKNKGIRVNRKKQIKRGLYLGFQGDWHSSVCILTPLIEEILRSCFEIRKFDIYLLNTDNTTEVKNLESLVDSEEFLLLFGEDYQKFIQYFYLRKWGPTLRHSVSHGLLSDDSIDSDVGIVNWATFLALLGSISIATENTKKSV